MSSKKHSCRILSLMLAFWLWSPMTPSAAGAEDWYQRPPASTEAWEMRRENGKPWVRWLAPVGGRIETEEKILVFFPKPSLTYDQAMEQILRSFESRQRWSTFLLVFYQGREHLLQRYQAKAERGEFVLIFAMGSKGATDLHRTYRSGSVPVVTVGAKDPVILGLIDDYEGGSKTNIAYTSLNVPVEAQLSYIRQVRPKLRQIGVVYSSRNESAVRTQVEPLRRAGHESGLAIFDVVVDNPKYVRRELATKTARARRQMSSGDPEGDRSIFWITGSTIVFSQMDVVLEEAGPYPVLAVSPSLVHGGRDSALLSIGVSFESNGELAALYALKILDGLAEPGELDVGLVLPPDIAINMQKAKALGIKIPFQAFETAGAIYDYQGQLVRWKGHSLLDSEAIAKGEPR